MICKHCGTQIQSNSKFCIHCGSQIETLQQVNEYELRDDVNMNRQKGKKKYKVPTGIKVGFFAYSLVVAAIMIFFGSAIVAAIVEEMDEPYQSTSKTEDDEADEAIAEEKEDTDSKVDNVSSMEKEDEDSDTASNSGNNSSNYVSSNPNATDMPDTIPLLTYALSFDDIEMSIDAADWYDFIYGEGYYDYGSVDDYFRESSKGMFTFVPADETYNTAGDGIIDIKMDMKHPAFNFSRSDDDYYSDGYNFYSKVLNKTDKYIDFSQYDKDGDGYIVPHELTIVFIFAGYEQYDEYDYEKTTFSCSLVYDYYLEIDGIKIDEVIYTGEKDPYNSGEQIAGIGILCHELGHALDLPDLYDTDYSSEGGVAFHDLMSSGCNNATDTAPYGVYPAPLTAWEREFLGFEEPEEVDFDGTYTLYARSDEKYNIIKIDDGEGYYLIENVDFEGFGEGLDEYLKSPGIAIWYVDKSTINSPYRFSMNDVNDDEDEYGYTLMEAHDTRHMFQESMDYGREYDHYHYLSGDNLFESDSGISVEILDDAATEMRVKIVLPKIRDYK